MIKKKLKKSKAQKVASPKTCDEAFVDMRNGKTFEIKPGTLFLGKTITKPDSAGDIIQSYDILYVYEIFEKQLKAGSSIHCRCIKVSWNICSWLEPHKLWLNTQDMTGRVDGFLRQELEELGGSTDHTADFEDEDIASHEFSVDNLQDLSLLVQKGVTIGEILQDELGKKISCAQKEQETIKRRLKSYKAALVLFEDL